MNSPTINPLPQHIFMQQIAKTEWLKMKKYPAFWWVMGITALTYPGINYMFLSGYERIIDRRTQTGHIAKMILGNPFAFPETWHTVAYFSSWFIFMPAIVIIMLITNEYNYKTNRQNIIDGWSRQDFMMGKLINVVILSVIVTLLYTLMALIMGLTNPDSSTIDQWGQIYYIGLFALQTFSQLSLAFLVGFLVRRSFIALAIFLFYSLVVENVLVGVIRHVLHSDLAQFFPMEISDELVPWPQFFSKMDQASYKAAVNAVNPHIFYTIILIALTWFLCFRINSRRDL